MLSDAAVDDLTLTRLDPVSGTSTLWRPPRAMLWLDDILSFWRSRRQPAYELTYPPIDPTTAVSLTGCRMLRVRPAGLRRTTLLNVMVARRRFGIARADTGLRELDRIAPATARQTSGPTSPAAAAF